MLERSSFYYRSHPRDHRGLSMRIKELAMTRIRFGYLRLTVLLKREGWPVGKKLVYRLYRELKLQVRSKRRKKLASQQRGPIERAQQANQRWSMDFVSDRLEDGRRFRVLTIIDQYHRYSPALVPALSFSGARVVVKNSTASPGGAATLERLPVTMGRSFVHGLLISGRIYTG